MSGAPYPKPRPFTNSDIGFWVRLLGNPPQWIDHGGPFLVSWVAPDGATIRVRLKRGFDSSPIPVEYAMRVHQGDHVGRRPMNPPREFAVKSSRSF